MKLYFKSLFVCLLLTCIGVVGASQNNTPLPSQPSSPSSSLFAPVPSVSYQPNPQIVHYQADVNVPKIVLISALSSFVGTVIGNVLVLYLLLPSRGIYHRKEGQEK